MKAIVITGKNTVALQDLPTPEKAAPGHIIIKMQGMGINPGDLLGIAGTMPKGFFPESRYNIAGVSGAGTVVAIGEGVPGRYAGKNVMVYRSLKFSEEIIGTWSEYAQLHYLQCAILPAGVNMQDYAGSLVNIITPFAFVQQVQAEGHYGIIATAGTSATGLAMLGICLAKNIPLISIARDEAGKQELERLGAKHILVQTGADFKEQLQATAQALQTTAVFDGVGGAALTGIMDVLPAGSTIYCYGYLGGLAPVSFHTSLLMKGVTLKGFSNFRTSTVQDPALLEQALTEIGGMAGSPHFTTKAGSIFGFEQVYEALAFSSSNGGKAILAP